ncbi:MAG: hypothetical protein J6V25_09765 [Oscillospiraceae bacterium]|nr:hypothetical protein [Oscillospiraceae bacterium]
MYSTDEQKKLLKKYIRPKCRIGKLLLGCALIPASFLVAADSDSIAMVIGFFAAGLFFIFVGLTPLIHFFGNVRHMEKNLEMTTALQDFADATSEYNDKLRFGKYYVFARRQGKAIPYCEISRVYPYIHTINHIEVDREIRCKDLDDHEFTLCVLDLNGKDDAQMLRIFSLLTEKNAAIEIGY